MQVRPFCKQQVRASALGIFGVIAILCGCGSTSSKNADDERDNGIPVTPPGPQIRAVQLGDGGAAKIRQGFGAAPTNKTTHLIVTGGYLDGATNVSIASIPGVIVSNSPEQLVFSIDIPHGAPLGPQSLNLSAKLGSVTYPNAITITPITAAPTGTDTATSGSEAPTGTEDSPFRSLAKAIAVSGPGDTILLKNGTYDQAGGDAFAAPNAGSADVAPNVPAALTIRGESVAARLIGSGKLACADANARVGLVLAGDAQIETLDISNFCVGIYAKAGTATIKNVVFHDMGGAGAQATTTSKVTFDSIEARNNAKGVAIHGSASATFKNARIVDNNPAGVEIRDSASVVFSGGNFQRNTPWGIDSSSTNSLTVTGTDFNQAGIFATGIASPGTLTIDQANVIRSGVFLENPSITVITNTKFRNHEYEALSLAGNNSTPVKVRGSTFSENGIAVKLNGFVGRVPAADFGTPTDAGRNTFDICANCTGIFDNRFVRGTPITVAGNTWTGMAGQHPPAGCSAKATPSTSNPNFWMFSWEPTRDGECTSPTTGSGNVIIN